MMIRGSFVLFSTFQAVVGGPAGSKCCGTKTVGDIASTLVETEKLVPMCYQGCGPDFNTKIVDSTPHDISTRPSFNDCWDYCRSLCTDWWCPCHAWSYHEPSETCYTYPGPFECHQAAPRAGWVSGGLCFEENTRPILEKEVIPGGNVNETSILTIGNLYGANSTFDDRQAATGGVLNKVIMYTGTYNIYPNVIVGIKLTYGETSKLHGNQTENKKECKFETINGLSITEIYGTAIESPSSPAALIYSLGFRTDSNNCYAGNQYGGNVFRQDTTGQRSIYVSGRETPRVIRVLGQLTFNVGKGEKCNPCSVCDGQQSRCETTSTCKYEVTTRICKDAPVDGEWGNWEAWGNCKQPGNRERSRECNNPPPAHGGAECHGSSTETQSCTVSPGTCTANLKGVYCVTRPVDNKCNYGGGYRGNPYFDPWKLKCCCKCCHGGSCGASTC